MLRVLGTVSLELGVDVGAKALQLLPHLVHDGGIRLERDGSL